MSRRVFSRSGVYFLVKGEEIVDVGASGAPLRDVYRSQVEFDRFAITYCKDLGEAETRAKEYRSLITTKVVKERSKITSIVVKEPIITTKVVNPPTIVTTKVVKGEMDSKEIYRLKRIEELEKGSKK